MGNPWVLRRAAGVIPTVSIILSYILNVSISLGTGIYVGGLDFPYFSDTGRDPPTYYIFATFNSITAIFLMIFMVLQYQYIKAWTTDKFKCRNTTATVFGLLAPIFLIVLSVVSTNESEDIHAYSAYAFFIFMIVHVCLSASIYVNLEKDHLAFKRLSMARRAVGTSFFFAFLLYIPVGLAIVCEFENLSLDDCINKEDLGEEYCNDLINKDNANFTVLYDYTNCETENLLRSGSQFCSIFTLLFWFVLHYFDPIPSEETEEKLPQQSGSTL